MLQLKSKKPKSWIWKTRNYNLVLILSAQTIKVLFQKRLLVITIKIQLKNILFHWKCK